MTRPRGRVRRLLADLRRGETRNAAVRRIAAKAAATLGLRRAGRREGPRPGGSAGRPTWSLPGMPARHPAETRPAAWYTGQWTRLVRTILGAASAGDGAADPALAGEAARAAARHRAQADLAESLARGEPMELAVPRCVALLTDAEEWNPAWALAEGVARLPGGATAAALGHALHMHRRRNVARAWTVVRGLGDEVLRRSIPVEAVDAGLGSGTPEGRARALAVGTPDPSLDPATLVDLAGRFLAFGEAGRAAELVAELRRRPSPVLDDGRRHALAVIERGLAGAPVPVPAGAVALGLLAHGTPDPALPPATIGNDIQTFALAANLARLTDVAFTGEDGLGELVTELQGRVAPGLRVAGTAGRVHLLPVDRDFSSAAQLPAPTWLVASGWHMHALFHLRTDFPYHSGVRPLFVSFHVNRLEMITEAGLEYLRRYGPVGCRDWTTVFLLLSAGVDAFFTGCLTTTVDAVFPARADAYRGNGAIGVIDLPAKAAGKDARRVRLLALGTGVADEPGLAAGARAADRALGSHQRELARAITGQLEAYLPLVALGVPVDFRPASPGDERLAGLVGMVPEGQPLAAMQTGIRDLLAGVLERVVRGAGEDEVYARWRELTRAAVAEARRRFEAPVPEPRTSIDVPAAVASARRGSRRFGPHGDVDPSAVTDLVLCYDRNLLHPAAVLLESVLANASGPVRMWLLGRGLPDAYLDWLAAAFPALPWTHLPCDQVSYGADGRPKRIPHRITISTMDRLLLPAMLDDVDRVVYLDVDTVMLGDLCQLARTGLDGHPIAARDSFVSEASEWQRAGRRLAEPDALELRRRMALQHGFGGAALNAGVLVMDLDRMRRDDFAARFLGLVEAYGLNDQDSMLAYAGPARQRLEPHWNTLPVVEDMADPRLVHWASLGKPWEPHLTWGKGLWMPYADSLRNRAGDPPLA